MAQGSFLPYNLPMPSNPAGQKRKSKMKSSNTVPGTFKANDGEWQVTKDGSFIIFVKDLGTGEVVGHVGPSTQWIQCVQDAAKAHREAWEYANCINVCKP